MGLLGSVCVCICATYCVCLSYGVCGGGGEYSLVPRPSLTAFFVFATAAKKALREGLGTRLGGIYIRVVEL